MRVSELVRGEIQRRFSPGDADELLTLLEKTEIPFLDTPDRASERARVHLAILLDANGDLDRARRGVELATWDWRDLLITAGMEHAIGRRFCGTRGTPSPDDARVSASRTAPQN